MVRPYNRQADVSLVVECFFCYIYKKVESFQKMKALKIILNILISLVWLAMALKGFTVSNNQLWGHTMFRQSLKVLLVFCLMLIVGGLVPLP